MKDRFVIVLDPNWNTSEDEALDTMRHEACHVATGMSWIQTMCTAMCTARRFKSA